MLSDLQCLPHLVLVNGSCELRPSMEILKEERKRMTSHSRSTGGTCSTATCLTLNLRDALWE